MTRFSLLTALTLRNVHAVSRLLVLLAALTGLQQLSRELAAATLITSVQSVHRCSTCLADGKTPIIH